MGIFGKFKKNKEVDNAVKPAMESEYEDETMNTFNVTHVFGGIEYDGEIEDAFEFDMDSGKFRMVNDIEMFHFLEEIEAYHVTVACNGGIILKSLDEIENDEDVLSIYVNLRLSYTSEDKFMASFYENYDDSKSVKEAIEKAKEFIEFLNGIDIMELSF